MKRYYVIDQHGTTVLKRVSKQDAYFDVQLLYAVRSRNDEDKKPVRYHVEEVNEGH